MNRSRNSRSAFTRTELVVVVLVVGTLLILLFANFGTGHTRGMNTRCRNNAKEIAKAVTVYTTHNNLMLPTPDAARFPAFTDHFSVGGGLTTNPKRIDPGRPLSAYIKDPIVFSCGLDRGYSGVDASISTANDSMFKTHGASFVYSLDNVTSCGLVGLRARRLTDPILLSSSNKVLIFEACFAGPAGKPADSRDHWHDNTVRAGVAALMDGHGDFLKVPASQTNHSVVPNTVDEFVDLKPPRTYY